MLLRPTLEQNDVQHVMTDTALAQQQGITAAERLPDCNRNNPLRALYCGVRAVWMVLKQRPHAVISTGAAPGLMCLLFGRLLFGRMLGARTLWIDSVANGEELSMCGKLSMTIAHQCRVQWEDLAMGVSSHYRGAVL